MPVPDKVIEYITLLMYALAAISGGLGGCAAAGHHILRGQQPRASYVLAYGIIGVLFGVLALAYGGLFGAAVTTMDALIGQSVLAGAVGSITLASSNLSARWVLKKLGIEVVVSVRRRDEDPTERRD